jgi:SPP1 gp7 family putative phage head morphogenesis protein
MTDFSPKLRREREYAAQIAEIMRTVFGEAAPEDAAERARMISSSEFFERWALQAAEKMVTGLRMDGEKTWRAAAAKSMRGREIYRMLQQEMRGPVGARFWQLVRENATLIRSLPQDIAQEVAKQVATAAQEGRRPESFENLVPHVLKWKCRLIARTETQKASTALTQARSEDLGVEWYVWETSQDERVRRSHRKMQGTICRWDDPPNPERLVGEPAKHGGYPAGDIYNCRCYPAPLLRYEQVSWPHRVAVNGQVRMTTLAAFRRMEQSRIAA